jgi:hypothetical protein
MTASQTNQTPQPDLDPSGMPRLDPATLRGRVAAFLDTAAVRQGITAVILFNALLLGMETSASIMAVAGEVIVALDTACLAIFVPRSR